MNTPRTTYTFVLNALFIPWHLVILHLTLWFIAWKISILFRFNPIQILCHALVSVQILLSFGQGGIEGWVTLYCSSQTRSWPVATTEQIIMSLMKYRLVTANDYFWTMCSGDWGDMICCSAVIMVIWKASFDKKISSKVQTMRVVLTKRSYLCMITSFQEFLFFIFSFFSSKHK